MGIQINGNTNNINAGIGSLSIEDINELDIVGVATAANFKTGVSNLHSVGLSLSGGQIDVGSNIKIGTAGVVTATTFSGSGASLTNLNASNIASGTVPTARLGSGTASSSTFLRGDSTFQTVNTDLVSDTSPQLGGDLDTNSHHILLDDSHSVKWGNATELEILHTGSSGYAAVHNSQGNFLIDTTGNFYVRDTSGSKTSILANPAGSTELYYDNQKRLYTDSDGVTIGQSAYAQLKIDGQVGDCILKSSGAEIELTRGSASNILCSNSAGYLNIFTGGYTNVPAMRIFASAGAGTGAKVGINTDQSGGDWQMAIHANPSVPSMMISHGIRILSNTNSDKRINFSGVNYTSGSFQANNNWNRIAIGRYMGGSFTLVIGDASSKNTIFGNFQMTAPNYGVGHLNKIASNGAWNTGSSDIEIQNDGMTYDYAIMARHNSYYNSSATASYGLITNLGL